MARDIKLEDKSLSGVHRFRFTIKKDGVAWTGIDSVLLIFEKPDRETQFTRNATLELDASGIWYYTTTEDDLDTLGYWTLSVKVTDGSVVIRYPYELAFKVAGEP